MHPYNPYHRAAPDFAALAAKSDGLSKVLLSQGERGNAQLPQIDFQDAHSLRTLTEAILEHEFGLHVTLRTDRLCPPVPSRLNYIAWLQEVMDESIKTARLLSPPSESDGERPSKRACKEDDPIRVLDVGTGSCCIYPILGSALHGWQFIATDVDSQSLESAKSIIADPRNNQLSKARLTRGKRLRLGDKVHLVPRSPQDGLLLDESGTSGSLATRIGWWVHAMAHRFVLP